MSRYAFMVLILSLVIISHAWGGEEEQDEGAPERNALSPMEFGEVESFSEANSSKDNAPIEELQQWQVLAFSPDGETLAGVSDSGTICLWKTHTLDPIRTATGDRLFSMVFSPDGRTLAGTMMRGGIMKWDFVTDDTAHEFKQGLEGSPAYARFSPTGELLVVAGHTGRLEVREVATGEIKRQWNLSSVQVDAVTFSSDGRIVAMACNDGTLTVWGTCTGKELNRLEKDLESVRGLALAPDGSTLVTVGYQGTLHVWDTLSGSELKRLEFDTFHGTSLAFSADSRILAAGSNRGKLQVLDLSTGDVQDVERFNQPVYSLAFSPTELRLLAVGTVTEKPVIMYPRRSAPKVDLTAEDLDNAWEDLKREDARGFYAAWTLRQAPAQSISFLQARLMPPPNALEKWADLIANLDHDEFQTREEATRLLTLNADEVVLDLIAQTELSLEAQARLKQIQKVIRKKMTPAQLRIRRAVGVLEALGSAEARAVLEALPYHVAKEAAERLEQK